MTTEVEQPKQLNYLGFVNSYSDKALSISASYYTWGKSKLPPTIQGYVAGTEKKVTELGEPYYKYSQGLYGSTLKEADGRVKYLMDNLETYQKKVEELQTTFKGQQEKLYTQMQEGLDKVKEKYPGLTQNVQKQVDDARKLPSQLSDTASGYQAKLYESWNQLLQDPRVVKVIESTKPQVEQTQKYLQDTQEKILADERYAKLYGTLSEYAKKVQATQQYQAVGSRVYPVFKTYAGKVVTEDQAKQYQDTLMKNITPKTVEKSSEPTTSAAK